MGVALSRRAILTGTAAIAFPARSLARREEVPISRLVSGFDPNGADNTDILQRAIAMAVDRGIDLGLLESRSVVAESIIIPGPLSIRGPVGARAVLERAPHARHVFYAENIGAGLTYSNLAWTVHPATESFRPGQVIDDGFGWLVQHVRCHGIRATNVSFDARNGERRPTVFAAFQNLYGDDQVVDDLRATGVLGSVLGPHGDGTGRGGHRHRYSNLVITGGVDTGVGGWTGAQDLRIRKFQITPLSADADPALIAYPRVAVDCAGATDVDLDEGRIRGGTIGVRIASNKVAVDGIYHNGDILLGPELLIENQEATGGASPEPGQGVKIAHAGPGPCRVTSRARFAIAGENGVLGYATDASGELIMDLDGSRFSGTGTAIALRGLNGRGNFQFVSGVIDTSDFQGRVAPDLLAGSGRVEMTDDTSGVVPNDRQARATRTANAESLFRRRLAAGLYRIRLHLGDVPPNAVFEIQLLKVEAVTTVTAANAGQTLDFWVSLPISYDYAIVVQRRRGAAGSPVRDVVVQRAF